MCPLGKSALLPSVFVFQPSSARIFTLSAASLCENTILLCIVYCVQVSADVNYPVLGIYFFYTGILGVFILICCPDLGVPLAKASPSPSDRNEDVCH